MSVSDWTLEQAAELCRRAGLPSARGRTVSSSSAPQFVLEALRVPLPDDTPELDLGPVQKLLAQRERELLERRSEPMTADEAGAIVHAHRGKHSEETRCAYCAVDGAEALQRLRDRLPLEERSPASRPPRGRSSSGLARPDSERLGYSHRGGRDTEAQAAARILPTSGTARARVLQSLARAGARGRTDEEISTDLQMRLYTAAPRRTTGSSAIVWALTDEARHDPRVCAPEPEL